MLTSERIVWVSEEVFEVLVEVGMKFVPLLSRDSTVSGDSNLVGKLWIL